MPHIVVKEFKEISFPQKSGNVEFHFLASNIHLKDEKYIYVTNEDA